VSPFTGFARMPAADYVFDNTSMLHNVALNGTLGVISGLGNIAPAALVKVFKLYKEGKFDEAKKAQEAVSIAGELEIKGGVPGMRVRWKISVETRLS
jgi:dihydrodipicolinate synthase/N-acetylneuraminate lyase